MLKTNIDKRLKFDSILSMKLRQSLIVLLLACFGASACGTVTIRPQGSSTLSSTPTDSTWNHTFFWGLIGAGHVNAKAICRDRPIAQMQAESSVANTIVTLLTLGIYYPKNAYVWCGRKVANSGTIDKKKTQKPSKQVEDNES